MKPRGKSRLTVPRQIHFYARSPWGVKTPARVGVRAEKVSEALAVRGAARPYLFPHGGQQSVEARGQEDAASEGVAERQDLPRALGLLKIRLDDLHGEQGAEQHEEEHAHHAKDFGHQQLHHGGGAGCCSHCGAAAHSWPAACYRGLMPSVATASTSSHVSCWVIRPRPPAPAPQPIPGPARVPASCGTFPTAALSDMALAAPMCPFT